MINNNLSSGLILEKNGDLWHWDLSLANTKHETTIKPDKYLSEVVAAELGAAHSLALKKDGSVWCWGDNGDGQCGMNDGEATSKKPAKILNDFIAIAAGGNDSLGLKKDGSVWAWGAYVCPVAPHYGKIPAKLPGLTDIVAVTTPGGYGLALKKDTTLWGWGYLPGLTNSEDSQTPNILTVPTLLISDVKQVAASPNFIIILKNSGEVWGWGVDDFGQLCLGASVMAPVETDNPTLIFQNAIFIVAGDNHVLAMKNNGEVWAWGDALGGNMGRGKMTPEYYGGRPYLTQGPKSVKIDSVTSIHATLGTSFAWKKDGSVWTWGQDIFDNKRINWEPVLTDLFGLGGRIYLTISASIGNRCYLNGNP